MSIRNVPVDSNDLNINMETLDRILSLSKTIIDDNGSTHLIFTPEPGHVHCQLDFKDGIKRPNHSVRRFMYHYYHPDEGVRSNELVRQTCEHIGNAETGAGCCIHEHCLEKILVVNHAPSAIVIAKRKVIQEKTELNKKWASMSWAEYAEHKRQGTLPKI